MRSRRSLFVLRSFSDGIVRRFPTSIQPYLRLIRFHAPIGTALTFWPSVWSLALCNVDSLLPPMGTVAVFGAGAFLMRSAGCVVNDMWDRDIDGRVERTASRPLASGQVSMREAVAVLGVTLSGAASLLFFLNDATKLLAICSIVPVVVYPWMKRLTWMPQGFLGLTFNWGALMGSTALTGSLTLPATLLYAGCVAWTVSYDTLYAHQDKRDDAALGLRSSALLDDRVGNFIPITSAAVASVLWSVSLALQYGSPYAALGAAPACAWALWLAKSTNTSDARSCGLAFRRSNWVGPLMLGGILAAHWAHDAARAIATMAFHS